MAKNTCLLFSITIKEPSLETRDLADGDCVTFGNSSLKVISTPGHTWGSVLFYSPEEKMCFTGDTLFAGSCGRTDLPEGDSKAMYNSLVKIIAGTISPDTTIWPGHGPDTTMEEELAHNPYLREDVWRGFNLDF